MNKITVKLAYIWLSLITLAGFVGIIALIVKLLIEAPIFGILLVLAIVTSIAATIAVENL